jgi:hypothetical protein
MRRMMGNENGTYFISGIIMSINKYISPTIPEVF